MLCFIKLLVIVQIKSNGIGLRELSKVTLFWPKGSNTNLSVLLWSCYSILWTFCHQLFFKYGSA